MNYFQTKKKTPNLELSVVVFELNVSSILLSLTLFQVNVGSGRPSAVHDRVADCGLKACTVVDGDIVLVGGTKNKEITNWNTL